MGIQQFIKKVCVQTAVYWGSPVPDGYGKNVYANAVEISCRWDDVTEIITNKYGKEIASSAQIMVTQDLSDEGYLYLGSLDDFDSGMSLTDPLLVPKAFPIQKIEKSPEFRSTTKFVRTVYL